MAADDERITIGGLLAGDWRPPNAQETICLGLASNRWAAYAIILIIAVT